MFDEFFNPPPCVVSLVPEAAARRPADLTCSPMDVKTAFLNDELREVVYGTQPEGFVDQDNQNHVYKLKKALYGLKQAPHAWYDMLSSFLLSQEFSKGAVDPTLFTKKAGSDILLVQIYVDDIIFAFTNPATCDEFAKIMTYKFKMSMMEIWYAIDPVDTPIVDKSKLDEDLQGKPVDPTKLPVLADIFTRALPRERFNFLIEKLGMKSMSSETLKSLAEEEEE
ncbi:retrovirus-related pol polyprotein from transposon TNT 1-94 [Tanacetum coccineum]